MFIVPSCEHAFDVNANVNLQVRVWNASTGSCLAVGSGHMAAVGAVAFSKKKKNFVVSGSRCSSI